MLGDYVDQMKFLLEDSTMMLSDIKPSEWAEKKRTMTTNVSPFPGPFSYRRTPYLKEVVDCLSPYHPAKEIFVMKAAQIGFTTGVIETGIGWIIEQNPGNILSMTGHSDLSEEAMNKIDVMIDNSGLRPLIRSNALRSKNMRTGDTNKSKEFPGGSLVSGAAGNHKLLMQRSMRYGFIDDYDAAKVSSSQDGSTRELIEQRFAAYNDKMKILFISTPRLKHKSNIEEGFLLGDQRYFHVPCPLCAAQIVLHWSIDIPGTKEKAGIHYKLDSANKLIADSVGYICQECGGFFTDSHKYEMNLNGEWIPTAEPSKPGFRSYHISALYSAPGMFDWEHYVRQYLEAYPIGQDPIESKVQTFQNLVLGNTYEERGESIKANELQQNVRPYEIGIVPEKISIQDGNGKIVLITLACDLNGTVDDARLDWEIVAWSESESCYSIDHGSIGTFVPLENTKKFKEDRERWTYEHHRQNSVWPELEKVMQRILKFDTDRSMGIFCTVVDSGHYTLQAYTFVDSKSGAVFAIKGDKDKPLRLNSSLSNFSPSKEKPGKLYMLQVNHMKDEMASRIRLKWDSGNDDRQPPQFMNFPTPADGKYLYKNYFAHYEAETRIVETKDNTPTIAIWKKKNSIVQNHFWDVRIYNHAAKEIYTSLILKQLGVKNPTWQDYVKLILNQLL